MDLTTTSFKRIAPQRPPCAPCFRESSDREPALPRRPTRDPAWGGPPAWYRVTAVHAWLEMAVNGATVPRPVRCMCAGRSRSESC